MGLALIAAITAARFLTGEAADGLTFLYVVPISVLALGFGVPGGLAAALAAIALFALWAVERAPELGSLAYGVRASVFVLVGALTGHLAGRLNRALSDAQAGALHFQLARDMLCTTSMDGRFLELNGSWEETLGWSTETLLSRPFLDFVHPDDRELTLAEAARLRAGCRTVSFTNRYRTRDGDWRWIEWSSRSDTSSGRIYAAARDVTDRRQADAARREAEERFRRGFEDSSIGMAVVGIHGEDEHRILEANDALGCLLGFSRETLIGMATPLRCANPEDGPRLREGMQALREGRTRILEIELEVLRADGTTVWAAITSSIVRDAAGQALYRISQVVDVSARKEHENRLQHLADHDPLTGVYNRRRFEAELRRELAGSYPARGHGALLMLDLDRFKPVNDELGHDAGDRVLVTIARALHERLRGEDAIARVGGDEFAVLLRRVGAADAEAVAADLVASIDDALAAAVPEDLRPGVSIGITLLEGSTAAPATLLRRADAAMYRAKARGGGRAVFAGRAPRTA